MSSTRTFSSDPKVILDLAKGLTKQKNPDMNMASISWLLYYSLPDVNWVGFYLLQNEKLVLGHFLGKPACAQIDIGKGVCGAAAEKQETIVVHDVHEFTGHIACDPASNSEIVVPIMKA